MTPSNVYAVGKVRTPSGRTTSQLLHRLILGVTHPKIDVDHEGHNGLNCQRSNLRSCLRGENDGNRRKSRGASNRGLWRAHITIHKTLKFVGRFRDEREAAVASDAAARAAFGEFANCNFPLPK